MMNITDILYGTYDIAFSEKKTAIWKRTLDRFPYQEVLKATDDICASETDRFKVNPARIIDQVISNNVKLPTADEAIAVVLKMVNARGKNREKLDVEYPLVAAWLEGAGGTMVVGMRSESEIAKNLHFAWKDIVKNHILEIKSGNVKMLMIGG
jgi:hypothetical protein